MTLMINKNQILSYKIKKKKIKAKKELKSRNQKLMKSNKQ